jgi:hypothetical protein
MRLGGRTLQQQLVKSISIIIILTHLLLPFNEELSMETLKRKQTRTAYLFYFQFSGANLLSFPLSFFYSLPRFGPLPIC